jgi:hypothetical protein
MVGYTVGHVEALELWSQYQGSAKVRLFCHDEDRMLFLEERQVWRGRTEMFPAKLGVTSSGT